MVVVETIRAIRCGLHRMAARAVREAKRQYPEIRLILLLPYYETSTSKYGTDFDGIIFPEGQETIPKRAAIIRANQYMIDHCDFLIMYARHIGSNTREFMDYAQRKFQRTGKPEIINLADWDN